MVTTTASVQLFNKAFAAAGEELRRTDALEKDVWGMFLTVLREVGQVLKLVDAPFRIHTSRVDRFEVERGVILGCGTWEKEGEFLYKTDKAIFLRRDGQVRWVVGFFDGYYFRMPRWGIAEDSEKLIEYFKKDGFLDAEFMEAILNSLQSVFADAMAKNEKRHGVLEQLVKRLTPVAEA